MIIFLSFENKILLCILRLTVTNLRQFDNLNFESLQLAKVGMIKTIIKDLKSTECLNLSKLNSFFLPHYLFF